MDLEALSRTTQVRMHHPELLKEASSSAAPKALVAFAAATLAASLLGIGGGFVLGSAATVAIVAWLHHADVRRTQAQEVLSGVAGLSATRAGILLRETAGDRAGLQERVLRGGAA